MIKKTLFVLLAVISPIVVFAQQSQQPRATVKWAISDIKVQTAIMKTPHLEVKNETSEQYKIREKDNNTAKHWIAVIVDFKTNVWQQGSGQANWGKWLDNIKINVDVFFPACDSRGNSGWGILPGEFTVNSVAANDSTHSVCIMIPPDVIYRYFNFEIEGPFDYKKNYSLISSTLNKYVKELPIYATVTYGNKTVAAVQVCGKNFYDLIEKCAKDRPSDVVGKASALFCKYLKPDSGITEASTAQLFKYVYNNKANPTTFKLLNNALYPISKTPFAWTFFDRFETINEETGK